MWREFGGELKIILIKIEKLNLFMELYFMKLYK